MRERQRNSTGRPITFLMTLASDHISGATGITPAVTISKDGGAFVPPAGAVTEVGNGWYALAGNASDRDTLGALLIHATAAGCDPMDVQYTITGFDPFDGVRMGMSAFPNVAQGSPGALPTGDGSGRVTVASNADKSGYSLTQGFPTNFSALAIDGSGRITVGGYATGQDPATLVLDVAASAHNNAGTIGNKINATGSVGDPWTAVLPGTYAAGTAGRIVGTNLDAAVSSRSAFDPTAAVPIRTQDGVTAPTYDDCFQGAWSTAFAAMTDNASSPGPTLVVNKPAGGAARTFNLTNNQSGQTVARS